MPQHRIFTLTLQTYTEEKRARVRQDVAAHSLGQDEAYFTVREILAEASTAADGVLWREPSVFCRCRFAMLGLTLSGRENSQ